VRDDLLIAVPNVSEGRDERVLAAVGDAYARAGARVLDVHSDPDHDRSVFTLAGAPGTLGPALAQGVAAALQAGVDVFANHGIHPHVGAVDVAPVVHLDDARRGAACAEALVAAHEIGELGVPVLLYGALTGAPPRTRAQLRRGGAARLAERLAEASCGRTSGRRARTRRAARRSPPRGRRSSPSTSSSPRPRRWRTPASSPPPFARAGRTGSPASGPSAWCSRTAAASRRCP
jgi:glutamate formiminotransferase